VLGELVQTTTGTWITRPPTDAPTDTHSAPAKSSWVIKRASGTAAGTPLRDVVAASASDPEMARAVLDHWLHPRRAAVAAIVRQAAAQGELRDGTDVHVIVDALVSPPYYRLLFALTPLDDGALIDLLETVWRGCRRSDALP
jgi:hypothetical protein